MTARAVVGLQWGDEGKGKIVDLLASRAQLVVRYQGGANAGHTVVVRGRRMVSHLVPSGAHHPGVECVIGAGVVLDPAALLDEIGQLREIGIDLAGRLWVSERAHVVFAYHKALDQLQDSAPGAARIGTTGRGIGPCYGDKVNRTGIRVADLYDEGVLASRLAASIAAANDRLVRAGREIFDLEATLAATRSLAERIRPHVCDAEERVAHAIRAGREVLFEGAQGTLLDVDLGTYPYVTSSNAGSGGIPSGTGLPLRVLDLCLGVTKAYATRVGEGPFPTELRDDVGSRLREVGREYGATTGRPRRCGWLDGVALRYAARVNGADGLAVMKLDCLSGFHPVKICRAYRIAGAESERFPAGLSALERAEPVYEELPGWDGDISRSRGIPELPSEARHFLSRTEEITGAPVTIVSVGPGREQTIEGRLR